MTDAKRILELAEAVVPYGSDKWAANLNELHLLVNDPQTIATLALAWSAIWPYLALCAGLAGVLLVPFITYDMGRKAGR